MRLINQQENDQLPKLNKNQQSQDKEKSIKPKIESSIIDIKIPSPFGWCIFHFSFSSNHLGQGRC